MQRNYRRCVSCRRVAHRDDLLRVVRTYPTGAVQCHHGMGRSAYLCPQIECLSVAHKKNRLGRALKAMVPDAVYQQLHQVIASAD